MIGLLTKPGSYAVDDLVACGKLPLAAVDVSAFDLPHYHCPYGLPVMSSGKTVIVVSGWLHELQQQRIDIVNQVLVRLRERFQYVIGFDHADPFQLDFSNDVMDLMDVVLKVNGVYNDVNLYNYVVGATTPNGRWTERIEPRQARLSPSNLKKVNLSIPCFLGVSPKMRAATRPLYSKSATGRIGKAIGDQLLSKLSRRLRANQPPCFTTHFFASLSHVQRATASRILRKSSLCWKGGITSVPPFVTGMRGIGLTGLSPVERAELRAQLAAEGLMTSSLNRFQYQMSMLDCKAVLSITGYGELCFRMAEAWANRRILVCQDISHVRTLFPFKPGRNVIYCRPDLSNLIDILDDIECNFSDYIDVAEQGYQDWIEWSARAGELLKQGFAPLYN